MKWQGLYFSKCFKLPIVCVSQLTKDDEFLTCELRSIVFRKKLQIFEICFDE